MFLKDKILLEKLIAKYTKNGVTTAINRLNENRKRLWCGVPEVYHIYNGDWETPEVEYDGCRCSEWDIQDSMTEYMKELIADGEDWGDPSNDKDFCRFCQAHAEQVQQDIIDFSGCNESLNESDDSEQYIEINGDEYVLVDPYDRIDPEEWDDSFAMINCLKKGECMSYYNGTWCYRDINGKIWQCYKDDQENYWSI